jgi:hypothetical protein
MACNNLRNKLLREYILLELQEKESVNRAEIAGFFGVQSEIIKEILTSIAIMTPQRTWKLKLEADQLFISQFPSVVDRFQLLWKEKEIRFIYLLLYLYHLSLV